MQHHSAPTRLLDWTASPLVAAYFAVVAKPELPGIVWVFHLYTVRDYMNKHHGGWAPATDTFEREALMQTAPPKILGVRRATETDRMAAQQSFFTVSTQILADHGRLISSATKEVVSGGRPEFFGIRIAPELKPLFLRMLFGMNVTAKALFPGVDGLGRSVEELVDLEAYHQAALK
jgi:hypothetical protein